MSETTPEKRTDDLRPEEVQQGNQSWWTKNPMTYDWRGERSAPEFSPAWYDAMDAVHLHAARLFATKDSPFDRVMPLERLKGLSVLEIGCGMGLHSETLARAGAKLTAVDLTPTAIEATRRRFALKNLEGNILQADAERLPFESGSFDFVWSWGVIHHSSRTGRIVREIARVLKPEGECRVMVYNREGMSAKLFLVKDYLLSGAFLSRSYEEALYHGSDGFSARFYVRDQFEDLFRTFFDDVSSVVCGQDFDAVPLPRALRALALQALPEGWVHEAQARRGSFLFLTARKPR